jgi:hypothetical protein
VSHLTPEQLTVHLDGAESAATRAETERHLAGCATCRETLAGLKEMDASLGRALTHDPGEEYFATFAGRVEQRLRASGLRGAQARGADERERRWMEWLRSPRRLAWIGATVAVIGGAAIVLITSREDRLSAIDESRTTRESRRASAPPAAGDEGLTQTGPAGEATAERVRAPAPVSGAAAREPAAMAPRPSGDTRGTPAPGPAAKSKRATSSAGEGQAAAPTRAGATPHRMMEVKKDANGNWVPAEPGPALRSFAAPPSAPPGPATGGVRVRKPGMATPLDAQKDEKTATAETSAPAPAAARNEAGADQLEAGEVSLCGGVLDASGRPVAGASVSVAATGHVTFSGSDGHFCTGAPAGDQELIVHAVGFAERRMQVRVAGEQANVQITLDAVSVLGDGTQLAKGAVPEGHVSGFMANSPTPALQSGTRADPFAGLPDSTRRAANEARRLSTKALGSRNAAAYELAAGRWEHVLESVPVTGAAATASRYRVAEARYGAWDVEPTADRARAAAQALDAFLATAPEGAERDLALRWRAALPH